MCTVWVRSGENKLSEVASIKRKSELLCLVICLEVELKILPRKPPCNSYTH